MKRFISPLSILVVALAITTNRYAPTTPAFPGAEGLGRFTHNVFYNWGPTNGGYAGEGGKLLIMRIST